MKILLPVAHQIWERWCPLGVIGKHESIVNIYKTMDNKVIHIAFIKICVLGLGSVYKSIIIGPLKRSFRVD